jgi:hypothetical protein
MREQTTRKRLPNWAVNLGLALGGIVLAALLAQGVIALFPRLLPRFLRPDPYSRRRSHPDDIEIIYRAGDGDLFIAQPGSVAPPPDPEEVLTHFILSFDEDGFRRSLMEADSYPIITLGDSLTDDAHQPVPWPDALADELNTPVRNLGFQGTGPVDYVEIMSRYGSREPHEWVVIGYAEANDLPHSIVDKKEAFALPGVARQAFLAARGDYTTRDYGEGPWKYPVSMQLGGRTVPLSLFEFYLWFLNGELEVYENSLELVALGEHLASIEADAGDACVLLAYFPDKSHIYFPYITEPANQASVLSSALELTLDDEGRLEAVPASTTPEELISRLDNQRTAVRGLAERMGIHFVDVTEPLKEAAARGEETYYIYDTHWNPLGHEIAGRTVAEYIRRNPCKS